MTQMLARMAIWTNNPDAVERWQGLYWDNVVHGGAPEADRVAYEAALYGLRGDRSGATTRYREALRRYRELRLDLDEAMMAIDMVYVLGPADPLTKEVVARARTTFAANHARAFLDQLDAALAHGAHEAAGQVAPSRQAREAGVPTT